MRRLTRGVRSRRSGPISPRSQRSRVIWDGCCAGHSVAVASVPLFAADANGVVDMPTGTIRAETDTLTEAKFRTFAGLAKLETGVPVSHWEQPSSSVKVLSATHGTGASGGGSILRCAMSEACMLRGG